MEFHPNELSDLDDLTEEHLGFSALSDGLGFSKSREKIPAASVSEEKAKQMAFSGIGAVAAGPAMPVPNAWAQTKPRADELNKLGGSRILALPAAPRWMRLLAFFVDGLVVSLPLFCAWVFSFGENSWEIFRDDWRSPSGLLGMIFASYFLLAESFGGQSLGKMLLGLRVVEDDKYQKPTGFSHALLRLTLLVLSVGALGIGPLASLWDSKKRPWHDRFSKTIVRPSDS